MRVVLQRVKKAALTADGEACAAIGPGLVAYVGIGPEDNDEDMRYILEKIWHLRVFEDANGKLNLSVKDLDYEVMFVSNFTLYGDCRHGRRPSYSAGAPVEQARELFERFRELSEELPLRSVFGVFQADMEIDQLCSGPVTLLLDSGKEF